MEGLVKKDKLEWFLSLDRYSDVYERLNLVCKCGSGINSDSTTTVEWINQHYNFCYLGRAITKDGIPIEIGKTYYRLRSFYQGLEVVKPTIDWEFADNWIGNHSSSGFSIFYGYDELFSTAEAACKDMRRYLLGRIESLTNDLNNVQNSLELLEKLERNENIFN